MGNLSKQEKKFRLIVGILLVVAILVPNGNILAWIIAIMMILTGLIGNCLLYNFLKK